MTPLTHARSMRLAAAASPPADLETWNRALNREHAMKDLRARGGPLVRAVEARRRAVIARRVRRLAPRVAIDAGTEDGWVAEAWAGGVEHLVLVDIDPDVLATSRLLERPGVEALAADATDAGALARGLRGRRADVVVASALLEHLPEPRRALAALGACLGPGGRLVVYVPADGPILALKRILRPLRPVLGALGLWGPIRGLPLDPAPGHLHVFSRRSLRALLQGAGRIHAIDFDPLALGYVAVLSPREKAGP